MSSNKTVKCSPNGSVGDYLNNRTDNIADYNAEQRPDSNCSQNYSFKSTTYSQKSTVTVPSSVASGQELNGQPDIHQSSSEQKPEDVSNTKKVSSKEVERDLSNSRDPVGLVEDVVDGVVEAVVEEILETADADDSHLKRQDSNNSVHSHTESIKTLLDDPTSNLSGAQSLKSLPVDEEEVEEHTNFVSEEPCAENVTENNQPPVSLESLEPSAEQSATQFESNSKDPTASIAESMLAATVAAAARPRSPSIVEIKALSRHNSMIKSMDSLYERKPDSSDYTTETSSQSSNQLNGFNDGSAAKICRQPQHAPIKQKSKTSHFLKRHRRVSPVKQSIKIIQAELYPATLQKFDKPREALLKTFDQLDSANWEGIMVGLKNMVRLIRYHPENLDNQMHMICIQLTRSVRNLRSQVARAACQACIELFNLKSRCLEQECDDLVCALLHRTADTNRFLRADATRALESMCDDLNPAKILIILSTKGATHQNALVRTTTAKLLTRLVERLGCEKVYTMPRDHRDKIFQTAANLLLEGSLETRNYAKALFKSLSGHHNYSRTLIDVIPTRTYRNIEKTLKSIR